MRISLYKKLTTLASLGAGASCAYLAPAPWLKGFAVGFVLGKINAADVPPTNKAEYRTRYTYLVRKSLPSLITAAFNGYAYYVLVSKIALPIFFGMNLVTVVVFIGGVFLGRHAGHYFTLSRLPAIGLRDAELKEEVRRLRNDFDRRIPRRDAALPNDDEPPPAYEAAN